MRAIFLRPPEIWRPWEWLEVAKLENTRKPRVVLVILGERSGLVNLNSPFEHR
ncbi:hypothetical protein DSO57_1003455, partial [Entomophthora muscae]